MNILCINTCLKESDVSLIKYEEIFRARKYENVQHSLSLMEQIQEVISIARLQKKDIDYICVSTGPGSFTGIRIGLAVAKGMCQALDIPMIALNTFELIAYSIVDACDYVVLKGVGEDYYVSDFIKKGVVDNLRLVQESELQKILKDKVVASNEQICCDMQCQVKVIEDVKFDLLPLMNLQSAQNCHNIEPIYLRKPQAELQKKAKND